MSCQLEIFDFIHLLAFPPVRRACVSYNPHHSRISSYISSEYFLCGIASYFRSLSLKRGWGFTTWSITSRGGVDFYTTLLAHARLSYRSGRGLLCERCMARLVDDSSIIWVSCALVTTGGRLKIPKLICLLFIRRSSVS